LNTVLIDAIFITYLAYGQMMPISICYFPAERRGYNRITARHHIKTQTATVIVIKCPVVTGSFILRYVYFSSRMINVFRP
jgi:DMSO reductase anchor subunit